MPANAAFDDIIDGPPDWGPLVELLGEELVTDFMWMFAPLTRDGVRLQAYKHIDTRCYIHLDADGNAYYFAGPGEYRPVPVAILLEAVLSPIWRKNLAVEPDTIARSKAALRRVRESGHGEEIRRSS